MAALAAAATALRAAARPFVRRLVPIATWLPAYPRAWLRPDLVAGVTSWGVMVPVAMAYADLAGLPPEVGLTTAVAALTAYAIFGTSRQLKVTTSSTMAIMSASVVGAVATGDPVRYAALSAALAIVVGVILVVAGLARLGFISEFLAKPVVTGFVVGLAVTIIIGQLPKLFGVPGSGGTVFDQMASLIVNLPATNPWTLAMGLGSLALIVALRAISRRIPAPLIVLGLSIVASSAFDLAAHGVAVIGEVPTGVSRPGLPPISILDIPFLVAGAAGIVFLAVGESLGAGRSFAARHRYAIDPDQELIALGAANLGTGLFGGFTVDASLSQTATADAAGARSQVASLVTAGLVLATAVVLAPLFSDLPEAVLGAIVIAAAASLVDVSELRRYYAWRRTDLLLAVAALVGVLTTTVLVGLVIAVLLSLTTVLYRASRPYIAVLGRLPGGRGVYADVGRHGDAERTSGLVVLRLDAPLYFFNANVAHDQILALVRATDPPARVLVLDLGATSDLDVTTTDMLKELVVTLREAGCAMWLAQVKGAVRDRMRRTGMFDDVGEDRVYLAVSAAVAAFRAQSEAAPDAAPPGGPAPGDAERVGEAAG
jgi:SulP family sulfate permease